MVEQRDRRYSDRYHFDNAKVYCQENSAFRLFKQFSDPVALNDLTKGGISFKTNKPVSRGDQIELKIDIPGRQKIKIKGRVVWVADNQEKQHAIGVQFLPFGTMKQYNSFTSREKLERLINPLQPQQEDLLQ